MVDQGLDLLVAVGPPAPQTDGAPGSIAVHNFEIDDPSSTL